MDRGDPPRILLVEDNPGDARLVQETLRDASRIADGTGEGRLLSRGQSGDGEPNVVHETRLEDGIAHIADGDPDVVLLDLGLPDSTGLDTLTTLREHTDTLPVVVLTGMRDRQVGMQALSAGADEYLVKDEINPDLLMRSVYHAIERKDHERELRRYETLIEESTDVNLILDTDGTVRYLTPSVERVLGYEPDELVGEDALEYLHPEDREAVQEMFATLVSDPEGRVNTDFRVERADGSWAVLAGRGRNLLDDPMIEGIVVYTHEITERREYERQLERQREQLAALNGLHGVVQGIIDAVVEQSTREEIEATVCEQLAASDSYQFAWVGEVDPTTDEVRVREMAGVEGYLDEVTISADPEDPRSHGPTGRAIHTKSIQTAQDVLSDPSYEPWRDQAAAYGFRSSAAIPIVHEDTLYGVLNVYAARPEAFTDDERDVIAQLGEVVGHAIASVERKQALMSDARVELEFRVRGVFDPTDAAESLDHEATFDRVVPVGNDEYLLYGRAPEDDLEALETVVDGVEYWEGLDVISDDFEEVRFELRASEPPVLSAVASLGGAISRAVLDAGDLQLTVQLSRDADVRRLIDAVQDAHPDAEPLARRQVTRDTDPVERMANAWAESLTDRQRTALEVAYYAGFFDWPRNATGEEVAESIGVSPATFHEHLRAAENKLFETLFEGLAGSTSREA